MDSNRTYRKTSPHHRQRFPIGLPIALLITVGIAAFLAFSPFGASIKERFIEPVLSCVKHPNEPKSEQTAETMAQLTPAATEQPTEEPIEQQVISLQANPYYILQMGQYETESDALLVSAELQSMGGGGYIYDADNVYRLFVAAYTDADSLRSVQQQIQKDGFVSEAFITDAKSVNITLQGPKEAVEIFKVAADAMETVPNQLSEWTIAYDKQTKTQHEIKTDIQGILERTQDAIEQLKAIDSEDVEPVRRTLGTYEKELSTFLSEYDSINEKMYAGVLKHLQLSVILAYHAFFEGTE